MSESRSPFEVVETLDRVTYRLPRQRSMPYAFLGLILILFSGLPFTMAGSFVRFFLRIAHETSGVFLLIAIVFAIFPLCVLALGLALLYLGIYLIVGRDELVLTPRAIRAVARLGPLGWPRSISRERLRHLTVVRSLSPDDDSYGFDLHGATHTLRAEDDRGRKKSLLRPYPYALIRALADDLEKRCRAMPSDDPGNFAMPSPVSVNEDSEVPTDVQERGDAPASSTAILERTGAGLRIAIPPTGFWRGSSLFTKFFVIFWSTGITVMVTAFACVILSGGEIKKEGGFPQSNWFLVLFFAPFVLVAIVGVLYLIQAGRRRAELVVRGMTLAVERWEWFRTTRFEWRRDELRSLGIHVQTNRSSGNATTYVTTLRIEPKSGKPLLILAHREKAELEWIATTLRGVLKLPSG